MQAAHLSRQSSLFRAPNQAKAALLSSKPVTDTIAEMAQYCLLESLYKDMSLLRNIYIPIHVAYMF